MALYVEELLIASNNKEKLENMKMGCRRNSKMKGLAEAGVVFEFDIYQTGRWICWQCVSQGTCKEWLKGFGLESAKGLNTPV